MPQFNGCTTTATVITALTVAPQKARHLPSHTASKPKLSSLAPETPKTDIRTLYFTTENPQPLKGKTQGLETQLHPLQEWTLSIATATHQKNRAVAIHQLLEYSTAASTKPPILHFFAQNFSHYNGSKEGT